jgi:Rap1a immunity proteins
MGKYTPIGPRDERRCLAASAFTSGLSWPASLGGKEVYCPPPDLKGQQVMSAFERFLEDHPDMTEKPYGDGMAASLSRAFPCQAR